MKVNDKINNPQKKSVTNNLILNTSIILLIVINILLLTTFLKNLSFGSNADEFAADSLKPRIQIEVLNGCGVSGKAEMLTNYLRAKGIDVVNLGNYRSFELEKSIIISRNNKIKNAQRIASAVGLNESSIISQTNPDYLLDVTLILGKDYNELIPLNKRLN